MRHSKLDKNEKGIVKDFESGKLKRIKNFEKESARYREYVGGISDKIRDTIAKIEKLTVDIERKIALYREINRRERWIHQPAEKIDVKLEY